MITRDNQKRERRGRKKANDDMIWNYSSILSQDLIL